MSQPTPPRPRPRPRELVAHGETRHDDWYWLRDRDAPEVLAHLEAENAYTAAMLVDLAPLRKQIFLEIRNRVRETDDSAPVPHGPYEYFTRTVEGEEHPILCRRERGATTVDVMLDANDEARRAGSAYFSIGEATVSPDHRLLAYTVDTTGGERHTLRVRDLASGTDLPDELENVYYGVAWSDVGSLWYVRPDAAVRAHQVWSHELGASADDDRLVFEEPDERFFVNIRRTRSGRLVVIHVASKTSSEALLLSTAEPQRAPMVVWPRRDGVEYEVEHQLDGDQLLITVNDTGPEFRLVSAPRTAPSDWTELVAHDHSRRIIAVDAFDGFAVLSERSGGFRRLGILTPSGLAALEPPEPLSSMWLGPNREHATDTIRFEFTSLTQPRTSVDEDVSSGRRTVVKRDEVLGGYDPERYESVRLEATAPDGVQVPISIVRPRDAARPGPMLLYGYGAYETSIDPTFSYSRLSLLERGITFATAHVRGGGELGRAWYDDGKLERKANTFTDFIACAEHLVANGYTTPDCLVANGRSAGGLLAGAIANMRPDLFRAVVAEVPFVDAITTMQDPSLPLTVTEWDEWGDPRDPAIYRAIRAYSPYDNVTDQAYPAILATAGLSDSRVQYWEPAKWVLKLRDHTTSDEPVLLKVEMAAGHAGPSGRYESWRDDAFVLAFVVGILGIT